VTGPGGPDTAPGRPAPPTRVAVLSAGWSSGDGELAAAVRSVAGTLSRAADVDVLVPGTPGRPVPDGAFDRCAIGAPAQGRTWPVAEDAASALGALAAGRDGNGHGGLATHRAVVVEAGDDDALGLATALFPGAPVGVVGSALAAHAGGARAAAGAQRLLAVDLCDPGPRGACVGLYARVHPGAAASPHQALGRLPPYVVVLGDRPGGPPAAPAPSERARWLLARFPRRHVVLVEHATAVVWRSRSPLRSFRVHSRMDLWRLLAHAQATVDLRPGPLYARECVESLRYGVPVVGPESSPVGALAAQGAALSFTGTIGLLDAVESLADAPRRTRLAEAGLDAARRWYGDPAAFLQRLAAALTLDADPPS
jgi:hypothetical protein